MKTGVKNLIKAVLFTVVFCLGLAGLYSIFKWKDTNGDYLSTFDSLYSLEKNTVDVVFAGPSYTYHSMNPAQFWEDYGIAAFTMSVSGQDKNSTVASVREVLKTQRPKIVMIDASGALFDKHMIQGNVYRNTISMKLSPNSIDLVNDSIAADERLDYWLRWPIVHTRYRELKRYDFEQYKPSVYSMGFNYLFNTCERERTLDAFMIKEASELSETNRKWIDELTALSEKYNFELIFYVTPGVAEGDYRRVINGVADYLGQKNVKFLDLDKTELSPEIDYSTDFMDLRHLNYYGSVKQVKYIAEYLKSNFTLADHRGEAGYDAWDNVVHYKRSILNEHEKYTSKDPVVVAQTIKEAEDLLVVLSLEGNYEQAESNIAELLAILGLTGQNLPSGETWVIEDGVVKLDATGSENYKYKISNANILEIERRSCDSDMYVTRVNISTDDYRMDLSNTDGMYILVYDKFIDKVVLSGFFH